jgi:hypothetical protein
MFNPKEPEAKHACYARLEQMRQLPGDLLGGLPALLERKATYFPREIADGTPQTVNSITVDPYVNRIGRLTLFNMFKDGIDSQLVGRVFSRPVKWTDGTPLSIVGDPERGKAGFADDVDAKATNASVFLRRRFRNAWARGLEGVLIDYPITANAGARSVDEERARGLRPFWRPYTSSSIWDWEFSLIDGNERLVYLKLSDTWTDPATGETMPCVRVFTADGRSVVAIDVWAKRAKASETGYEHVFSGTRSPHLEIPFVPFATDGDEPMEAEPELVDAAWLNLAHCRKTGAVDNSQHQINFPMLAISGMTLQEAKDQIAEGVGSHRAWFIPQPGGGITYAEPAGASWSAAEQTIAAIERRIDRLFQRQLERDSAQPLTAQGEANSEAARLSRLESSVQGLTDSTNTLLYFTAIDLGEIKPGAEGGWGGADYNTKWTAAMRDVEVVRLAYELAAAGRWPEKMAYQVAQRYGVAPDEVSFEEFKAMILVDASAPPRLIPSLVPMPQTGIQPPPARTPAEMSRPQQEGA